jgi:hypothetical protein
VPARSVGAGVAAVAGSLSLAAGVLVLTHEPAVVAESFGPTVTAVPTRQAPAPEAIGQSTPAQAGARDGSGDAGERTGRAATARRPTAIPPGQVSFTEAGVVADVVPVGVLSSGALQIPDDPAQVGWWAAGAAPGQAAGRIVLAGHMDGLSHGGAMSVLLDVDPGDLVALEDRRGETHRYRVASRTTQPRQSIDPALFTTNGPHRLVLITCGGTYDEQAGQYTDNIVVIAEPVTGE